MYLFLTLIFSLISNLPPEESNKVWSCVVFIFLSLILVCFWVDYYLIDNLKYEIIVINRIKELCSYILHKYSLNSTNILSKIFKYPLQRTLMKFNFFFVM